MENLTPKLDPRDVNLKGEVAKGAKSLLATNRLWHLACGIPSFVEKLASRVWRAKKKKKKEKEKGGRKGADNHLFNLFPRFSGKGQRG